MCPFSSCSYTLKAQVDESTSKPADESFHEINLDDGKDEFDIGAPKINLSFDEPEPKADTTSALWSSSWSFGGFGAKKEEKPKSVEPDGSSYFNTKKFSDFNFGFGAGGADASSFDIGDSKKDDLDDDEPFPAWGGSSSLKKEKKKKVGIEEVDDTLPTTKSKDADSSWGWDSKKTASSKSPETKKDPWASTSWGAIGKKDTKSKTSWADLVEEDEEEEKAADPLAAVLEEDEKTEDKGWGSTWGTTAAKKDKNVKKSIWDVDDSPKSDKKDDDPWGDFATVTKPKPGKKGKEETKAEPTGDKPKDDIWGWAATDGKKGKKDSVVDPSDSPKSGKGENKEDTELPPLSILKGLTVNKDGTLKTNDGVVVGEVIEGDSAKFARLMLMCDEEGNIKNSRGKVLGKAKTVAQEKTPESDPEESTEKTPDLSILEGLVVDRDDHKLYDLDGVAVGELADGDGEAIARRKYKCTAEGTFLDRKLTVVGRATLLASATQEPEAEAKAEDTAPEPEVEPVDISVLEGLPVEKDGQILDIAGVPIGKLVDGDAKVISKRMYLCSAEGIIFDKKLKQVGRAEVIQPEKPAAKEPAKEADEPEDSKSPETKARTLADLDGLTCDEDGKYFIDDVAVAELVEGKPALIFKRKYVCNVDGEVLDKKGGVIGRAEMIVEAASEDKAPEEDKPEDKPAEDPSRTLADLEGLTCDEEGHILIDGVAVAKVIEGDVAIMFKRKYVCTADGEVLNKKKAVFGRVELIAGEKPAEDVKEEETPKEAPKSRTLADLEGLICDSEGKFMIDNVIVAELVDGDPESIARRKYTCNADGEVLNKAKRVIGRAELVKQEPPPAGKPIEEVTKRTLADLKGLSCDSEGKFMINDIVVAEIVEGDAQTFARRQYVCNAEGGILNKKDVVVGRAEMLSDDNSDEKPADDVAENSSSSEIPPLSILDGCYIEKDGKVLDSDGKAIGEVIEGDALKMATSMYNCNAEGEVLNFKDKVVGKVRTLPRGDAKSAKAGPAEESPKEPPAEKKSISEAPPLSILMGLFVEPDGKILNFQYEPVGEVTEGDAKALSRKGATCDDEGNIILKKKKVGKAKTLTPEAPEGTDKSAEEPAKEETPAEEEPAKEESAAAEPPPLSILKGRTIESDGKILDNDYEVIGEVIEGDVKKMYTAMATCDAEGNVKNKKKVMGKVQTVAPKKSIEEPAAEEPPAEETKADEAPSLAILDGRSIEKTGEILDEDGKVIGKVADSEFSHNKLFRGAAKCDAEGNIIYKSKSVGTAELVLPEKSELEAPKDKETPKEEEEVKAEAPSLAILEGRTLETSGEILDDDGKVIGKLISTEHSAAKINKAKVKCDANGKFFYKSKEIGTAELIIEEKPAEETPAEKPEAKTEPPSLAILDGRKIESSGDILDDELNIIGRVSSSTSTAKKLAKAGAVCDAEGNIMLKNKEVGKAELVSQPEKEPEKEPEKDPEPEPETTPEEESAAPSFAILDGRKLELSGDVHDDDGNAIGKIAKCEHSARKLYKNNATCDGEGNIIVKNKKVGTLELVPQPKKEPEKVPEPEAAEEPEPEPPSLNILDGRAIDKDGNVVDDDGKVIGKLVESSYSLARLLKNKATCDGEGNIICKGKEMGTVELVVPDKSSKEPPAEEKAEKKSTAPKEPEKPDFSILDGKKIERTGEVLDDNYDVIAKLVEGSNKRLYRGKATCDAEGNAILDGLELGKLELVEQEKPAVEEEDAKEAEQEAEPESETITFASLDSKKIEKSGDVLDDELNIIAKLVEGSDKRLYKGKATCDDKGNAILAGKKLGKLELVEQEKKDPEPEPKPEPPTFADLKGRTIETSGDVLDDELNVIARLVAGSPLKLYKGTSTCDGKGNALLRGIEYGKLELVLPEPEEEKSKDIDEDDAWGAIDSWGTTTAKDKKKSGKTAKEADKDDVKELLDSINNPDAAWGDPWAETSKKKKRDSATTSPIAAEEKSSKSPAADWDTWSNSTKSKDKKKKAGTPKSEKSNPLDDSKIMKPAGVDEPKAETEEESGFAFANKKDKGKKKGSKNTPVEVEDILDGPIHKAETVEETKSASDPIDWEFASNRVKAKKGKTGTTPAKSSGTIARAPSPPEDDEVGAGKGSMKAIEAAPASGKKSAKGKTGTELSKSATKDSTKTRDLIGGDEDDLGPDDSASGYNISTKAEPPKAKSKKEETPTAKSSSGWGSIFGGSSKNKKLADLKKEKEERERKDKEEREKKEQQDREAEERLERERLEEERLEQERLEQEERDRAIKEAEEEEKARKEAAKKGGKKGKKTVATTSKTPAKEEAPAPEPPAPEPAEEESSKKADPFAIWGVQRKGSKKVATSTKKDVSSANQDSTLTKDAKKLPEPEVLPIRTKSSAAAPASSIKATKVATKGASIAERIKALQGETKLKETAAQTPTPPPPPPAPVVGKASKAAEGPAAVVDSSSKKTGASRKASGKTTTKSGKEKEPEPKTPSPIPGGFPDSDDDEPLIDLDSSRPATPSPDPDTKMGTKSAAKLSKKSDKKVVAKTTKATTKTTSKAKPATLKKAVQKEVVESAGSDSDTETEVEQDKTAPNADGTQGSGSTTAVDDTQPVDGKASSPPPDKSPAKKERPKVVRPQGGSSWGFWATATPKQMRQKVKEGTPAPLKGTSPPVMVRPRVVRKATAPDAEKSETEKKTPAKPTPKRAATFSLFGATPTRSKSTRQGPTQKSSSRPQSRRESPERTDGNTDKGEERDESNTGNDELPRVSDKAAKVMGISSKGGASTKRRASVKSKGKTAEITPNQASRMTPQADHLRLDTAPDPYAIDSDIGSRLDNGVDLYAESSPAAPIADKKSKRKSVATSTGIDATTASSANDDAPLVDIDGARAPRGTDAQDFTSTSRKPSLARRSTSRANPRESKGLMGIFNLSRSKTVKEPRRSDPTFGRSGKRDSYASETEYVYPKRSSPPADGDDADRRGRRERRKSRRDGDDEGFTTDAPGMTTDYEEADRRRAERRAARKAEKEREREDARIAEERAARKRDRDADREKERERDARRAARKAREEEKLRVEDEGGRRDEKDARRAAREARRGRDDEDRRREESSRFDTEAQTTEKEDGRRRRKDRGDKEPRDRDGERPRGDRRRSSYMPEDDATKRRSSYMAPEDDYKRRSSKRTPVERSSRRATEPVNDYFDARNAAPSANTTPYLGSDKDKTSSWVESVNKEPPLPIPPEDVATVIEEPAPEDDRDLSTDEEEVRRRMQGRKRDRRRESTRIPDADAPRDADRDDRRRERKRRERDPLQRSSDSGNEKDRRRKSGYDQYPDFSAPLPERPANSSRRQSWFKKIF
jgi:hypothetical protein